MRSSRCRGAGIECGNPADGETQGLCELAGWGVPWARSPQQHLASSVPFLAEGRSRVCQLLTCCWEAIVLVEHCSCTLVRARGVRATGRSLLLLVASLLCWRATLRAL